MRSHGNSSNSAPVFKLRLVVVLICVAIGIASLLIPRQTEVVDRLIADGAYERALQLLESTHDSPTALLGEVLAAEERQLDKKTLQELQVLIKLSDNPEEVLALLDQNPGVVPQATAREIWLQVADRAMEIEEPEIASKVYQRISATSVLNEAELRGAVAACRFSSNPLRAVGHLSEYLTANSLTYAEMPADLRMQMISLYRELNMGSEAFDLLNQEFSIRSTETERQKIFDLLTTTASQSNRMMDSIPILEQQIQETRAGSLTWKEIQKRHRPHSSDEKFFECAKQLAAFYEWNVRSEEAFVLYRKMAVMGDLEALDRCVVIYPWINKQNDLAELLRELGTVNDRPDYQILLAKLEAERGRLESAEEIFQSLVAEDGGDKAALWVEIGHVRHEQARYSAALEAYKKAVEVDSEYIGEIGIFMARIHVILGQYAEALQVYSRVPQEFHTLKSAEDYGALADSMADPENFCRSIQIMTFLHKNHVKPANYTDMATAWTNANELDRALSILREGRQAFPNSHAVRLAIVETLMRQRQYAQAMDELVAGFVPNDMRFVNRLLNLTLQTGEAGRALAALKLTDPLAASWSPSERLLLAQLYEVNRQEALAFKICQTTPGGEATATRIRARIAYRNGDYKLAWNSFQQYMGMVSQLDHHAWSFAGELNRKLGRTDEAREAYAKALQAFQSTVSIAK